MFSLLWSEHCAYKHSKKLLRVLPTEGPRVVMGPGENAGAVDIGGGLAVAFKVESHNHPSAVEPFQGAATGVGGILRDVFAIGARPIAVLDSLRFGEPSSERSRYLLDRVVAGIGHYGNSIGVPTVGGEVYFEPAYEQNCLVNAMCVGLAETDRLIPQRRRRRGQRPRPLRRAHRPRRHRRRLRAGQRRARRGRRGQAPERPDRRSVRGEEAARVLARAAGAGSPGLAAGSRRRRPDLVGVRDGQRRRRRDGHRRLARPAARARHGAVRDHGLRVPGAHALRRRARARRRGARGLREMGGQRHGDRRGHRHTPDADLRRRLASRRGAGGGARRRLPALRPRAIRAAGAAVSAEPRDDRPRRRAGGDPAGPHRLAEHRLAPRDLRAVRLPGAVADRATPGAGRRPPGPLPCRGRGAGGLDRRQRAACGLRSLRGSRRSRLRMRGQPGLRRGQSRSVSQTA